MSGVSQDDMLCCAVLSDAMRCDAMAGLVIW